jgi:hypothetical protein
MASFYLDIETTGTDEVEHKIITIQWQELERGTGKPIGKLHILKEWEFKLGESEMIQKFIDDSLIVNSYDFDFISVGFNLGFEHKFLISKTAKYDLFPISVLTRPFIDLHSTFILMNKGEFLGSGLDKMSGKKHNGSPIPGWYKEKKYDLIEDYIINETQEFYKIYQYSLKKMPEFHAQYLNFMTLNPKRIEII